MSGRLASLRVKLLVAMVVAGCAGLAGSYLLVSRLERSDERSADRHKALMTARVIAREAADGATPADLGAMQKVMLNDRIRVLRGGKEVYEGPPNPREVELTVTAPYPGGKVVLFDHTSNTPSGALSTAKLTLIAAGLLTLVIGVAFVVTTLLIRALRVPIQRATEAARRVASGDLGARIGALREDEFAELGSTFDDLVGRLEAADRDQRHFLADVAHEIATPVNAIRGFATAIADGTMNSDTERPEALELIDSQGRRVDALLRDLRELTRLDLTDSVRVDRVDVDELCRELVARFRPESAAAGVELWFEGAPGSLAGFQTDRRLLETVLDNLLSNAVRYTPSGGRIHFSVTDGREGVVISVRDTGIGIAREHHSRIFERLYRVDEARDRVSGGSGLGLALAQRAARAIGGTIELESEEGVGSEFRLVLPSTRREHDRV
ncbi:MAG TPA: HAMP domain-containing sensor histidine kinase [Gaiellaceae bacterium]|nr:HAMP domain-containing sensor histidine kinase [Gaiellaceae bacterium]